jgi:hypothetical protein
MQKEKSAEDEERKKENLSHKKRRRQEHIDAEAAALDGEDSHKESSYRQS